MNNDLESRAKAVFLQLLEFERPEEIRAHIDQACGEDAELRERVDALRRAAAKAGEFLAPGAGQQTSSFAGGTVNRSGEFIGRYKLLQELGEGGFGTVWMAEQKEPVKRRVALKVIKLGMDTRQVIARFEAERQALAMMDHPNIAKVLDAGATDSGRPYFVMEYIRGVPILEYCDTERLDTPARLALFIQVCHAIQHAHQKGIIHRDIKPSNVLVTMHDGFPVPKVIDFGVAKATNSELTTKTLFTEHRQMIGTPTYMSPEQAEMSGLDIDTRSDIYSLGVLLYELLTGTTPFSSKELLRKGFAEMMRIIREVEPHKPSTRLSSLGDTATQVAARRRVDLKKLGLLLRGDLDWIVMKCLEKDRSRRYETANGLAMDIKRHLSDEPVTASPPSPGYKLRKFVKRNRAQVIAGSGVAVALVLGVIGTSAGMMWALSEKARADREARSATLAAAAEEQARVAAVANELKAKASAASAERELARASEIKRLITEMLTKVSPEEAQGTDTTLLKRILDETSKRLEEGEINDELVAAELHHVVGITYSSLSLYPQAEAHLPVALEIRERLLEKPHPDLLNSTTALANLYRAEERLVEAEPLCSRALEISRQIWGDEHRETFLCMNNLANCLQDQRQNDQAESLYLKALDGQKRVLGPEDQDTLITMNNLGLLYNDQRRYAEAEPLFTQALNSRRRTLGESHPDTLMSMAVLAVLYENLGRFDKALPLCKECLEKRRVVLGAENPLTLGSISNLGGLYKSLGQMDLAATTLEECVPVMRRVLGLKHLWTRVSIQDLAIAYEALGREDEAIPLRGELMKFRIATAEQPDADAQTLNEAAWNLLTTEIEALRDPAKALQLATRACALAETTNKDHLMYYLDTLALAQHKNGDTAAAIETERRALSLVPMDDPGRSEWENQLKEFEAALQATQEKSANPIDRIR